MKRFKAFMMIIVYVVFIFLFIILGFSFVQTVKGETPQVFGYQMYVVVTDSMSGTYDVGDIIVSKKVPLDTLEVDDVVAYLGEVGTYNGKIVTHRIVNIEENNGEYIFTLKGDKNVELDPLVNGSQIKGKILRKLSFITVIYSFISNKYIFLALVLVPLVLVIYYQVYCIVKEVRKNDENGDAKQE